MKLAIFVFLCLFLSFSKAYAGPFILVDVKSGNVLSADRATDPWYPASITKLMTLYVAAKAIREGRLSMSSALTMSQRAARTQPSKMGFKVGTKVTMESAFPMLIVKSANDIAVAIAERVSGSQEAFVAEMNNEAKRLGMRGSRFTNPHGLPSKGQYVTARDMALLGIAFHREFPELLPIFDIPAIRVGNRTLRSFNLLLEHYRGASGMKTGFICAAGLNMVASAKRGNTSLIAVVLGEQSTIDRTEKAALILEHGFTGNHKNKKTRLDRFNPRPTRTTPVNLRPHICGGHRKIRTYQIVAPQPKPKKGLFARDKYVSPQRKRFGANLGDPSHPQGTLVHAPRGRKYRSHILQPYKPRAVLNVPVGAGKQVVAAPYRVNVSSRALARLNRAEAAAELAAVAQSVTPLPRANPVSSLSQSPVSASAFVNASNGVAATPPSLASSLTNGATSTKSASSFQQDKAADGEPLSLVAVRQNQKSAVGVITPRPNPLR